MRVAQVSLRQGFGGSINNDNGGAVLVMKMSHHLAKPISEMDEEGKTHAQRGWTTDTF